MTKTIPYFIQIVAITYDGTNLLWDSNKRDFVGFEKDVPQTDLDDLDSAQDRQNIVRIFLKFGRNLSTLKRTNL